MKTYTKILTITGGAILVVAVSVAATLSIQTLSHRNDPPPAPPAPAAPPPVQVAQVIAVVPHYVSQSKPVKHCYPTQQVVYDQSSPTGIPGAGAVIGGVAGGLAGSAVHGNGRDV